MSIKKFVLGFLLVSAMGFAFLIYRTSRYEGRIKQNEAHLNILHENLDKIFKDCGIRIGKLEELVGS